jgi:hypothetical protein
MLIYLFECSSLNQTVSKSGWSCLASNDQTTVNNELQRIETATAVVSYRRPPISTVAWRDWARLWKAAAAIVRVPALIRTGHLLGTSKSHHCYSLSQNSGFFSTRGMREVWVRSALVPSDFIYSDCFLGTFQCNCCFCIDCTSGSFGL